MEQDHKQLLDTLARSGIHQEFQGAFADAMRLPVALHPADSWQLPFHGHPHENPYCALLTKSSRACAVCLEMQRKVCHKARERTATTLTCCHGLAISAAPLRVDGQVIGFLETGQVFREPPDESQFNHGWRLAAAWGVRVDRAALKRAYFQGAVVPPRHYQGMVEMLSIFAGHLSLLGNQILVQQSNAEPLVIRRAKEYIHERHTESLRLAQVANAVNSSPFYFCKLFHKTTGINFTAYVAETRVEKAKNLLLNPDVQVSEIAYAVGFQSLTHFNRVFKARVGQTPTCYRQQVVGGPVEGATAN